jgi:hypothetical protein
MITLTLRDAGDYWRRTYGQLYESDETVDVAGFAAHSPHHPHRVLVYDGEDRTGGHGTHILDAQCIVIADPPKKVLPSLGTVREGDVVRLVYPDGRVEERVVTAQSLRDPNLVPADAA